MFCNLVVTSRERTWYIATYLGTFVESRAKSLLPKTIPLHSLHIRTSTLISEL
jgi:hypothetical protein